jgi:excisionase family DNA binding protein
LVCALATRNVLSVRGSPGTVKSQVDYMTKLLLRPAEVSELIGMGKSKTYELIASGVIPSVRLGKSVRVPADRLREWIEELQTRERSKTIQKTV